MRKLFIIACMSLVCLGPMVVTSCSSWKSSTHKTVGTVAISGDAAMKIWGAYVHSGKATADQEKQVRFAYEKYQASMNAVIDVGKTATTATNKTALEIAIAAATDAQGSLVKLVEALTKK